tara:strand:+ start:667 stop:1071 length:405 start_codon:yes stop_codon:yes gene_type:complete
MKRIAVSGYFDPIHIGHIEYLEMAKNLGDYLIVIINNDYQCKLKKNTFFQTELDRLRIVESLKVVDECVLSIDTDKTVCSTLEMIKPDIFANGGDRTLNEIPESKIMKKYNIKMVDGLGKKIRSSSDLTGLKQV